MKFNWILFSFILFFSACNGQGGDNNEVHSDDLKEPLIEANITYVEKEAERINAYINRHQWKAKESGTGLRYMIYHQQDTTGEKAREGQWAKVNFRIFLLDGTLCYSSEESGAQEFFIGRDDVESGLHEGITYMRVGDKAKMILPSHLAHGLVGDRDKIPARAPVIYDIELLGLR